MKVPHAQEHMGRLELWGGRTFSEALNTGPRGASEVMLTAMPQLTDSDARVSHCSPAAVSSSSAVCIYSGPFNGGNRPAAAEGALEIVSKKAELLGSYSLSPAGV